MERSPLQVSVGVVSGFLRRLPSMKGRQIYSLGIGLFVCAAFLAGGILLPGVHAAGNGGKEGARTHDAGNLRKDVFTVTAVAGSTISGTHSDGSAVTVLTTADTRYTKDGAPSSLNAITVGSLIGVEEQVNSDGSLTANGVLVDVKTPTETHKRPPEGDQVSGTITAIQGTTLTVQTTNGSLTVTTSATTSFGNKIVGTSITLSDLKVGDTVAVAGKHNSDNTFAADVVVVIPAATSADGNNSHSK